MLRPIDFQQHSVNFIIHYDSSSNPQTPPQTCPLRCWRVPHHLASIHWTKLLVSCSQQLQTRQLVLLSGSKQLNILSKFEDKKYIHAFAPAEASTADSAGNSPWSAAGSSVTSSSDSSTNMGSGMLLLFELPRYGLEFELLADGRMLSKDHSGYCLSRCQQLVTQRPGVPSMTSAHGGLRNCSSSNSSSQLSSGTAPASSAQAGGCNSSASIMGQNVSSGLGNEAEGPGHEQLQPDAVHYTLLGFQQYLMLEKMDSSSTTMPDGFGDQVLLIPAGNVLQHSSDGSISRSGRIGVADVVADIDVPTQANAVLQVGD